MSHISRFAMIMGAPLAIVALLACVTPAGAVISSNGLSTNGLTTNGLSSNGSPLGDLNGVAVEAVIIPAAATR